MQSLVVHVHRGIIINMSMPLYPFFFGKEYISELNKAMTSKCKHWRRVIRFFCRTTFLILYFLYKINFASADNLETIRIFSSFSSLVDIDVLTGLFCYFHLLSLQTVVMYIFLIFWRLMCSWSLKNHFRNMYKRYIICLSLIHIWRCRRRG